MSKIKEQITEAVKLAMKAREQAKVTTLRGLVSEIKRVEIDTRTELNDDGVLGVLQKELKKRRDALKFAEDAKRDDLIAQNKAEIALIQNYLGEQLTEEKLRGLISGLIAQGADNVGKVMGALNKEYKGKFEGKLASEIAKELLG